MFGKPKQTASVQSLASQTAHRAQWLNAQFRLYLEMKRQEVLTRKASSAPGNMASSPAAKSGSGDDDDWVVV